MALDQDLSEKVFTPPSPIQPATKLRVCNEEVVCIRNGSFGWTGQDGAAVTVLRDISIVIPKASLTVIRGPVASGKSTLLKTILGETVHSSGSIYVAGTSIAYCDQDVWLQNKTVRDNIICFSKYDDEWYREVVRQTALHDDIQQWADGDQTVVGSQGITLSGGQRRRVVRIK